MPFVIIYLFIYLFLNLNFLAKLSCLLLEDDGIRYHF